MNKTKFSLTITAMVLVAMIAIVSIIAVFAARTQNFSSNIKVTYTSREVQGTATAQYFTAGENNNFSCWQDMLNADGETELKFELEQLNGAALSPEAIELTDVNDYAVFKYDFTNDGPHPYELTMTYQDDDLPDENIKLYVTVVSQFQTEFLDTDAIDGDFQWEEYLKDAKEWYMDGNVFTDRVNTTVVPNSKIRIYLLLEVMNWNIDASFSGSINFDLDGTNAADYTEDFYYYTNGDTATLIGVAKGTPSEDEDYGIKYNLMEESVLNIPTEYKGLPIKTIGLYAFFQQTNLTTISSFGNVDCLASEAFGRSGLSGKLIISGSVKKIYGAFDRCPIDTVEFMDGVVIIGINAFCSCDTLSNVIIPNSVVEIGMGAFSGCENLNTVSINSQTVCENLVSWEQQKYKTAPWLLDYATTVKAKYEVVGLEDKGYTKQAEKEGEYWVYMKNA